MNEDVDNLDAYLAYVESLSTETVLPPPTYGTPFVVIEARQ